MRVATMICVVLLLATALLVDSRKTKRKKAKASQLRERTFGCLSEKDLLSFSIVKGNQDVGGFGMNMAADLTVTKITQPNGPAERAGVVVGVRIVEINGEPVQSIEEARAVISPVPFGDEVLFKTIPPPVRPEQGHFRPDELWEWLDEQLDRWMPEGKPYVNLREGIGDALDAGTGYESFHWLEQHDHNSITAVTMDPTLVAALGGDRVRVANLADEDTLPGAGYDVILADFFLAAANAYKPYDPELLLNKVLGMLRPGGLLLLVGQEPEDTMCGDSDGAKLFAELMRTRNQVPSLLQGRRPYRELPLSWVYAQLDKAECYDEADCFLIREAQQFRMGYELSQVVVGTIKALSPWPELAAQMSGVYAGKLEDVLSKGQAALELQCDVYYALVVQRKGSAALP